MLEKLLAFLKANIIKGVDIMIGIYAIRNTKKNILKHFLCQLNTT